MHKITFYFLLVQALLYAENHCENINILNDISTTTGHINIKDVTISVNCHTKAQSDAIKRITKKIYILKNTTDSLIQKYKDRDMALSRLIANNEGDIKLLKNERNTNYSNSKKNIELNLQRIKELNINLEILNKKNSNMQMIVWNLETLINKNKKLNNNKFLTTSKKITEIKQNIFNNTTSLLFNAERIKSMTKDISDNTKDIIVIEDKIKEDTVQKFIAFDYYNTDQSVGFLPIDRLKNNAMESYNFTFGYQLPEILNEPLFFSDSLFFIEVIRNVGKVKYDTNEIDDWGTQNLFGFGLSLKTPFTSKDNSDSDFVNAGFHLGVQFLTNDMRNLETVIENLDFPIRVYSASYTHAFGDNLSIEYGYRHIRNIPLQSYNSNNVLTTKTINDKGIFYRFKFAWDSL